MRGRGALRKSGRRGDTDPSRGELTQNSTGASRGFRAKRFGSALASPRRFWHTVLRKRH